MLKKIDIDSPAASGEIYLHGAHVTQFQPKGHQPVLFVSKESFFQADKPIRGGDTPLREMPTAQATSLTPATQARNHVVAAPRR